MSPKYQEMREACRKFARLLPIAGGDDLRGFCWQRHTRQGPRKERFEAGMALFVLHQASKDAYKHRYFQYLVPKGERELPRRLAEFFAWMLNAFASERGTKLPFPDAAGLARKREHPEVPMSFAFVPQERERLERFHARFASPEDGFAHLLLYRPRRLFPTELIRSFMAISPMRLDRETGVSKFHNVTHVYRAPSLVGHEGRDGRGWAVPLTQGLYLIVGQRPGDDAAPGQDGARPPREPFRSLDILYFRWEALESSLPSGLMMTSNKDGWPLISRVCAVPTSISRSSDANLGAIALRELEVQLAADRDREKALAAAGKDAPALRLYENFEEMGTLAARIAQLCNNHPIDYDVMPGFEIAAEGMELTKAGVAYQLERGFGTGRDAAFVSETAPFRFWEDLRFPPLMSL